MGEGAGDHGQFNGDGPEISGWEQGRKGRGDLGRTLLRGEIRGRWGMTGGPGGAVREGDAVASKRAERGPVGPRRGERTGVASWTGRRRGSVGPSNWAADMGKEKGGGVGLGPEKGRWAAGLKRGFCLLYTSPSPRDS